jgi:2-oxoglutarate ferredoxin oxidoreductase subunit beta
MNMTVMLHDNNIYGLTKMQMSPTTPQGLKSNTSPRGAYLNPLNPLTVTLGVENVSFVAQAVDWMPGLFYDILAQAFEHKGLSFIRVLQRCPNYLPNLFEPWVRDPQKALILTHDNGLQLDPTALNMYPNRETHDPGDLNRAREIASVIDPIPVGILYRNNEIPCYEDLRKPDRVYTPEMIGDALNKAMDKITV